MAGSLLDIFISMINILTKSGIRIYKKLKDRNLGLSPQIKAYYIIPPMPPIPLISGIAGIGLSSFSSLIVASVVRSRLATLTAF